MSIVFRAALCAVCASALLLSAARPASAQDANPRAGVSSRAQQKARADERARERSARARRVRAAVPASARTPTKPGAPAQRARRSGSRRARGDSSEPAPASAREERAPGPPSAPPAAAAVDAEIVKDGDTRVKVMKFSGLGIEGRLKSPQLLYFVQRVRAEFERPQLPHRSFMPELERATAREPVR